MCKRGYVFKNARNRPAASFDARGHVFKIARRVLKLLEITQDSRQSAIERFVMWRGMRRHALGSARNEGSVRGCFFFSKMRAHALKIKLFCPK